MDGRKPALGLLVTVAAWGIGAPNPSAAAPQDQPAAQRGMNTPEENNGEDFTRPENLIQLRYLYLTAPGSGSLPGTTREVTSNNAILRADYQVALMQGWKIAFRTDLPFDTKNPITPDNPTGRYLHGLGDADFQAALLHEFDARWAAGAGLRIIAPTGSDDLTSGKWNALPLAGFRYMLPELSKGSFFIALARYEVSFAGDPSKQNKNNLQFAPELNIALPDRWFVTFYPSPDIRYNFGDPITGQTGRLFLPADVMLGRHLAKNAVMSVEVSVPIVRDYPVYTFKAEVRLNLKF
jgi:hypothetical protein